MGILFAENWNGACSGVETLLLVRSFLDVVDDCTSSLQILVCRRKKYLLVVLRNQRSVLWEDQTRRFLLDDPVIEGRLY